MFVILIAVEETDVSEKNLEQNHLKQNSVAREKKRLVVCPL